MGLGLCKACNLLSVTYSGNLRLCILHHEIVMFAIAAGKRGDKLCAALEIEYKVPVSLQLVAKAVGLL
jgi:hypothetical protein